MTHNFISNVARTRNIIFSALVAFSLVIIPNTAYSESHNILRLGIVTFLSGPASGPFGVPAANAAKMGPRVGKAVPLGRKVSMKAGSMAQSTKGIFGSIVKKLSLIHIS